MVRREISLYTVPRFALDSAYMWIGVEN
jgi:hypothetical protein